MLDKTCLAVTGAEHEGLLISIARNLAYALRAPERRKRPRARLEVSTTPEGAARLLALAGSTIAGLKVLDVEPKR
jgi:hypothetical protein